MWQKVIADTALITIISGIGFMFIVRLWNDRTIHSADSRQTGYGAGEYDRNSIFFIASMFFIDIAVMSQEYSPASHRLGWPTNPVSLFSNLDCKSCLRETEYAR
jgi:hypothetical protein